MKPSYKASPRAMNPREQQILNEAENYFYIEIDELQYSEYLTHCDCKRCEAEGIKRFQRYWNARRSVRAYRKKNKRKPWVRSYSYLTNVIINRSYK